jgi:hypothetical protein
LLGTALDAALNIEDFSLQPPYRGTLSLNLNSDHFSGEAALRLDSSLHLVEGRPAAFRLQLTPNGYATLRTLFSQEEPGFSLEGSSNAQLRISAFHLPINSSDWKKQLAAASITADLTIDQATAWDKDKKHRMALEELHGHFSSSQIAKQVDYKINGRASSSQHGRSSWEIAGTLQDGFAANGSLDRQNLSLTLDASVKSLPALQLAQLCCLDPSFGQKIHALFGPTLDAKASAQLQRMQGPLLVEMKGTNAHFSVDAYLDRTAALLNKDLILEVKVTPELGKYVLQEVLPIAEGILSAEHPLTLTIAHEGTYIPLPFSIEALTIPKITIDLGKVYFSPASQLAKALSLLYATKENFQVWITPCYLSLKNGVIRLERTDLLIHDRYPLAAWGIVDLAREKVNMVIGLSGAALGEALKLSGIPGSYMLQLPLKGPLNNPSIDKTKVTARLSALMAQSRGGPHGAVLGTVLDIASGSLTEGAVPEPTTNPLPWEYLFKKEGEQTEKNEKNQSNPIEEIGKSAGSLLQKIFK